MKGSLTHQVVFVCFVFWAMAAVLGENGKEGFFLIVFTGNGPLGTHSFDV